MLFYAVLAMLPALLIGSVAILGRLVTIPDPNVPISKADSQAVSDYIPLVSAVQQSLDAPQAFRSELTVQITNQWIDAYQSGDLHELKQVTSADCGDTGVKYEIETARRTLMRSAITMAKRSEDSPELATQLLLNALLVSQINQYSTPLSMQNSSIMQRLALESLRDLAPRLDKSQAEYVQGFLRTFPLKSHHRQSLLVRMSSGLQVPTASHPQIEADGLEILLEADMEVLAQQVEPVEFVTMNILRMAFIAEIDAHAAYTEAMNALSRCQDEKAILAN